MKIKKLAGRYLLCRILGLSRIKATMYLIYKVIEKVYNLGSIDNKLQMYRTTQYLPSSDSVNFIQGFSRSGSPNTNVDLLSLNKQLTFIWFIPNCSNVWGGGHYTLFRFANHFANKYNTKNIIFLYDFDKYSHEPVSKLQNDLKQALPNCLLELETQFDNLPACHAAIATTWQSAYFVDHFQLSAKKFYFMQDYESLFYAAGANSLQANYTYSFGFTGITGGLWLKSIFESYGGKAQEYIFNADRNIFYPQSNKSITNIKKIFFYGRPSTERRAFELGIHALTLIAQMYPHIEIIIAGLDGLSKPNFDCILLGNLTLKETGDLYRTCDLGIALSATNLSYLPVELMASGCPVITNEGPQVEWFCKNEYNALVVPPTAQHILKAVERLNNDLELRKQLIENGLKTIHATTWEQEMDKIYHYIEENIPTTSTQHENITVESCI